MAFGIFYDTEAFGRFSEAIARFLGTARFLVAQTVIVIIWVGINALAVGLQWDPYPFILLNLMFSVQAAYAAPLILLAQNRQAERDRVETERDRQINARTQADAEYLAREVASIRVGLQSVVTVEDLAQAMAGITDVLDDLAARLPAAPEEPTEPAQ
ncbi:MAG: DUF1003 domain-containing protein [Acidimicrobiia bacterium]